MARSTEATRHTGPCGGFSTQYACMCDLHAVPYRDEVAWVGLINFPLNNLIQYLIINSFDLLTLTQLTFELI